MRILSAGLTVALACLVAAPAPTQPLTDAEAVAPVRAAEAAVKECVRASPAHGARELWLTLRYDIDRDGTVHDVGVAATAGRDAPADLDLSATRTCLAQALSSQRTRPFAGEAKHVAVPLHGALHRTHHRAHHRAHSDCAAVDPEMCKAPR